MAGKHIVPPLERIAMLVFEDMKNTHWRRRCEAWPFVLESAKRYPTWSFGKPANFAGPPWVDPSRL